MPRTSVSGRRSTSKKKKRRSTSATGRTTSTKRAAGDRNIKIEREDSRIIDSQAKQKNKNKRRRTKKKKEPIYAQTTGYFDLSLFAVVIILISFGLIMLYSASAYESASSLGDDMYYFRRQAIISAGAVGLSILVSVFDYHLYIRMGPILYLLAIVLMAAVKFSPLGLTAGGATRWLALGPISFQPSEVAKIAIILIMPYLILRMGKRLNSLQAVLMLIAVGGVQMFAAYFFTENLSTGLIILGICAVVIFVSHPKTRPFLITLAVLIVVAIIAVNLIGSYVDGSGSFRIRRILVWLHPEDNMDSGGYQVLQGLYAIGSGGIFGKGLGNSMQKLSVIPEAQNDMIFAIVCEELGLFGAILLMLMFGYLLYRLLFIARNAPDLYGTLMVTGIFAHIALQVILNICVVLNVIPTTGVTLPFVSYGGTSVLFLMLEIGMALSVSRRIEYVDENDLQTMESEQLPKVPIDKTQESN